MQPVRGVIKATVALLDGSKSGRSLLAFVHLETSNWETTGGYSIRLHFLIEEIHTAAGDTAMILKVRTEAPPPLRIF
jgi:Lrp/AsnC family transcriptional regulator, leucine-responsive regulatory protein